MILVDSPGMSPNILDPVTVMQLDDATIREMVDDRGMLLHLGSFDDPANVDRETAFSVVDPLHHVLGVLGAKKLKKYSVEIHPASNELTVRFGIDPSRVASGGLFAFVRCRNDE